MSPQYQHNLKKRIIATVIDYGIFLGLSYAYITYFGYDNEEGGKTVDGIMTLPIPIVWTFYFVVVEAVYGATIGHQAMDLKVITDTRKEINGIQALQRHLVDPIDILFYGIPAIITILNSEKHQRLGDMWAKTIVVDKKDTRQYSLIETQNN